MLPSEVEWPTVEIGIEEDTWKRPMPVVHHEARFEVSLDRLVDILGLPEGTRILSIWDGVSEQAVKRTVTVMVAHPHLPGVLEGAIPVKISPTFEWCDMEGKEVLSDWGVT